MSLQYYESDFFEEAKFAIDGASSNQFPWHYQLASTSSKFPFFSHVVVARYEENMVVNSNTYEPMLGLLKKFCQEHSIKFNKLLRMSFNLMTSRNEYAHTDPHVDLSEKHKVFLLYLNDTKGDTFIFNEQHKKGNPTRYLLEDSKPFKVARQVSPQAGKAVCFNGLYYHANGFCNEGDRRMVFVSCFE